MLPLHHEAIEANAKEIKKRVESTKNSTQDDRKSGAQTYTVEYVYDAQGRLTTQTTNPGAPEQQITTRAFEPATRIAPVKNDTGEVIE